MPLHLESDWVWDFWFAQDGREVHLFFLHAPRSLGDPNLRHQNARIGHAVSTDLRIWRRLPSPLPEAVTGAADDRATWTGSVVRAADGSWHMFYTGVSTREDGQVQRILSATSRDLITWTRTDVTVEADPRWYEKWTEGLPEEHWRDPWVHWDDETQCWRMYVTARVAEGPPDGRGVIATARSSDLRDWVVETAVTTPGEFRQLEVPQLVRLRERYAVLFSAGRGDWSASRRARLPGQDQSGTHVLYGPSPRGPFAADDDAFLVGSSSVDLYAGRLIRHEGSWWFLAWYQSDSEGAFLGGVSDPLPADILGSRVRVELPTPFISGMLEGSVKG